MGKLDGRLKRVVLKEELMALTGDAISALVLQQMIYWSERTGDIDEYLKEEAERADREPDNLSYGWFYKTTDQLANEDLMGIASPATVRRRLQDFIKRGWLEERENPNPKYKWDRTLHYRVNILKVQRDLFAIGYFLEGYKHQFDTSILQDEKCNLQNEEWNDQVEESSTQGERAIPEITIRDYDTQITTESPAPSARESSPQTVTVTIEKEPTLVKAVTDDDPWGGAFQAFCEVAGHDPARLPPNAPETWRARLRQIGEDLEVGPGIVESAIRLRPFSDIAFKDNGAWRTPWSAESDIEYLILCYKSGKYGGAT